jgi:hypothetical protein
MISETSNDKNNIMHLANKTAILCLAGSGMGNN